MSLITDIIAREVLVRGNPARSRSYHRIGRWFRSSVWYLQVPQLSEHEAVELRGDEVTLWWQGCKAVANVNDISLKHWCGKFD